MELRPGATRRPARSEWMGEDGCSRARKGSPVAGLGLPWANSAVHGWLMATGRGGTVRFAGSALILVSRVYTCQKRIGEELPSEQRVSAQKHSLTLSKHSHTHSSSITTHSTTKHCNSVCWHHSWLASLLAGITRWHLWLASLFAWVGGIGCIGIGTGGGLGLGEDLGDDLSIDLGSGSCFTVDVKTCVKLLFGREGRGCMFVHHPFGALWRGLHLVKSSRME